MFRMLLVAVARWLKENGGERVRRLAIDLMWSPLTKRTVHFVRICRPCRHLSVDAYEFDARWKSEMFPVWSVWKSNRWGFSRVQYVGDCTYFRVPVPKWFAVWLTPIVQHDSDGWWFGNERTENWYRYRDVRVNEERERDTA